jgi:hypothetical protein
LASDAIKRWEDKQNISLVHTSINNDRSESFEDTIKETRESLPHKSKVMNDKNIENLDDDQNQLRSILTIGKGGLENFTGFLERLSIGSVLPLVRGDNKK